MLDFLIDFFKNLKQVTKVFEDFVEHLAQLIVTKNWVSLLLLFDAFLILFCFPGGILDNFIQTIFGTELPKQYPVFFWVAVGGIFLTALVIAIRTIQKKSPPPPDSTERRAIKGLRAFSREDAEVFAKLQRDKDRRKYIEHITYDEFSFGILIGESGVGKTSFLQAGIIPNLLQYSIPHRGIYVSFSNQNPIETIYEALEKELTLSKTQETPIDNRDLLSILSLADKIVDESLILILDQFEQFYIHFKQKEARKSFNNALENWYKESKLPRVKILISIREDFSGKIFELEEQLEFSRKPNQNYFKLNKFSPKEAAEILQVIAETEGIKFDRDYIDELTNELANEEDSLISPVDLQVLAEIIETQKGELQAFDRTAFQKMGGIKKLMTKFLKDTLAVIDDIPNRKTVAINVLSAMTNSKGNAPFPGRTAKGNIPSTLVPADIKMGRKRSPTA